ncbi:MAG: TRAP transporter small permease subunit [Candidatus Rokubacteria bacterium]|nr:TRAP transporter small permease subunit [Candidatus Rokubacteria bacterium]
MALPVETILKVSNRLTAFVEFVGRWGSVFILPLVFVTMWDVFLRKIGGMQYWLVEHLGKAFESTVIQEFEWHFHTALFTLVLGYGMVRNRHVRVDLVREKLPFRYQAVIEFLGLTFFMIPYCLIVGYFASVFAWDSFAVMEKSASTVGLSYRWVIKTVLVFGMLVAFVSGVAVWLQALIVLWGPKDLRFKLMTLEWPEDAEKRGGKIIPGV